MARRDLPDDIASRIRAARDFEIRQSATIVQDFLRELDDDFPRLVRALKRGPAATRDAIRQWHRKHTQEGLRDAVRLGVEQADIATDRRNKALRTLEGDQPKRAALRKPAKRPRAKTRGDKLALENLRPNAQAGGPANLRRMSREAAGEAVRRVSRGTSAAKQLVSEANQLIPQIRRVARADPRAAVEAIDKLRERGRDLAKLSGDREGWASINRELRRIRMPIKEVGVARRGTVPALRDALKWAEKQPETALRATTLELTETAAQRWIRTEAMAAHRAASLRSDRGRPHIVGYRWKMQRARHGAAVRRRFGTVGKGRNRRANRRGRLYCVCEIMDDRILSPDIIAQYPRGGHPNCFCLFEPVYDPRLLFAAV